MCRTRFFDRKGACPAEEKKKRERRDKRGEGFGFPVVSDTKTAGSGGKRKSGESGVTRKEGKRNKGGTRKSSLGKQV